MSYIRASYPLTYVNGVSVDYVFGTQPPRRKKYIEDYGKITDSGIVELLFDNWKITSTGEDKEWDELFKRHLLGRLAERLNVKIRKKALTDNAWWKLASANHKKFLSENKNLIKKCFRGVKTNGRTQVRLGSKTKQKRNKVLPPSSPRARRAEGARRRS